jgi:hypothetical protein
MAQPKIDAAEVNRLIDEGCRRPRAMEKPAYTAMVKQILEETGSGYPTTLYVEDFLA